nr:hypothetical protein [Streptomyces fodineus]
MARVGPASLISSRNATKATAVQSTPRPARAARAEDEGTDDGRTAIATGA